MEAETTGRPPARGGGFVAAATLLAAAFGLVTGVWALAAPDSFAEFAGFPTHVHFLHDIGAFQIGIGVTLLLALAWRDGLAVALAGFLVGNTVHTVNHFTDLDLGGSASDAWQILALSLLTGAALWLRARQLGWVLGEVTTASARPLERFVRQKTVLLTTYRRDGRPVAAPVSIAVDGDHAYFRSPSSQGRNKPMTGKAKRLRHTPDVQVAPCTTRGKVTGPALEGRAELLEGPDARHAARLIDRKYPFLQRMLVRTAHRLMGFTTAHYRLTPETTERGSSTSTTQGDRVVR